MVGTKINRWHMELDISGPAASIIRGQFVRSRLVSMTSAELRGGRLGPLKMIIRVGTHRRIPLKVLPTTSKEHQVILVFGNHEGKGF